MTIEELNTMTKDEADAREKELFEFVEGMSFEDYKTAIRDTLFLWGRFYKRYSYYTFERANETVKIYEPSIKNMYSQKDSVSYAAIDVDYCCG